MSFLYIILGIAIGAVVLYVVMDKRMDALHIASGKKDIELAARQEMLNAANSRVQHLEADTKAKNDELMTLHAEVKAQARELEMIRQQREENEKLLKEQFANVAQSILEGSASKLKEQNAESLTGITQPLKEAIARMQQAISDTQKESAAHSASFREQMLLMMPNLKNFDVFPDIPIPRFRKHVNFK